MPVLSELEARFDDARQSSKFIGAWQSLKLMQPLLGDFAEPEHLRDFCRNPSIPYEKQDPLIHALCIEARREAENKANWRFATDLLVWVFLPALLNVAEQASTAGILSQGEAEGEAVSGLWEMAIGKHQTSEGLSGRLVNAGRHQVWRSIRSMSKEDHSGLDTLDDEEATPKPSDPVWADPWMYLCWAQVEGQIPGADAELIFWTRLHGESLHKISSLLGHKYKTGQRRRHRAEKRLAHWYSLMGDTYPPRDPKLARECLELARKPSELARKLGRSRVSKWPSDVLVSEGPEGK